MRKSSTPSQAVLEHIKNGPKLPSNFSRLLGTKITNLYQNSEIYNAVYKGQKGDKNFYIRESKKGKILYLGIGSGRIFKKIAQANNLAYGLDFSSEMTSHIYIANLERRLIFADVLEAEIQGNSFDKIIAPFCFLNQFDYENASKIVKNCSKWLKPNGIFVTDFFSPFLNPLTSFNKKTPRKVGKIIITSYELYDFINQRLLELTLVKDKQKKGFCSLPLYYYYPNEIRRLMLNNGFEVQGEYGSFDKKVFTTKSDVFLVVAKNSK